MVKSVSRRELLIDKASNDLISKWQRDYSSNPSKFLLSHRTVKFYDNKWIFFLTCVNCNVDYPALPKYFHASTPNNHRECESGSETFRNYESYPCRKCHNEMIQNLALTTKLRIKNRMRKYKLLRSTNQTTFGQFTDGWFWEQWYKQGGRYFVDNNKQIIVSKQALCNICKHELNIIGDFSASINNMNVDNKGDHLPDECELICSEHNVAQSHKNIKDLKIAWTYIFEQSNIDKNDKKVKEFIEIAKLNWNNQKTKHKNGVVNFTNKQEYNRMCNDNDLFHICNQMANSHRKNDLMKNRENNLCASDIYELLLSQPLCYYSGGLLTIENGPMRFSVERLDNTIGHIKTNVVLISRMMNSTIKMTKEKFLQMKNAYLTSKLQESTTKSQD